NIASANRQLTWTDDYGVTPSRVRTKVGTTVSFMNASEKAHTISARDGSWTTGTIQPGATGSAIVSKAGTFEYICTDHPWTIGQLTVKERISRNTKRTPHATKICVTASLAVGPGGDKPERGRKGPPGAPPPPVRLGALALANLAKPRPKPPFDLTGTWQH